MPAEDDGFADKDALAACLSPGLIGALNVGGGRGAGVPENPLKAGAKDLAA